jgi:integrase
MTRKRRFGRVRRLPSGRWQARYKGPDDIDRPAPSTFATKSDAERWLSLTEADIIKDNWRDPDVGRVLFADYARSWVAERPNLRPKTLQLYEGLVRIHLVPGLGPLAVADITGPRIRQWRKNLLDSGVGPVTVAKAYRLLKAIMTTAVDDRLIRQNPCRIKGAGEEKSPERPVLTLSQVFVLADAFADRRYRLLILLAVFCSLRWGELAALRRKHINTSASLVRIEASVVELVNGALVTGPPKSSSGVRWVSIPPFLLPDVIEHLEQFTGPAGDALVFTGPKGAQLRRSNFTRQWRKALEAAGMTGLHFHDLRHTGNTLAGEAGASLRELMDRMGHSTTRAALIYQHRTSLRDKMIADEISRRAEAERTLSGTQRAQDTDEAS